MRLLLKAKSQCLNFLINVRFRVQGEECIWGEDTKARSVGLFCSDFLSFDRVKGVEES